MKYILKTEVWPLHFFPHYTTVDTTKCMNIEYIQLLLKNKDYKCHTEESYITQFEKIGILSCQQKKN